MSCQDLSAQDNGTDAVLECVFKQFSPQPDSNDDPSWYSQCASLVRDKWDEEKKADMANKTRTTRSYITDQIVVDIEGTRYSRDANVNLTAADVWGISIDLCRDYCGRGKLDMVTSFSRVASGSTNYLLPWLALTAQLPYETGSTQADIISVCVGLGSPLLMTFSLMMTILNKRWIRKRFGKLAGDCGDPMRARIENALVVADEAGQAPVRLQQKDGWLARLVVLDANAEWWSEAARSLRSTRRGPSLSLIAQLSVAVIAWILTVTGSLKQKVGDTEEALVLSSGSLWIWLVPVIIGWVMVGTQSKAGTVRLALRRANRHIDVKNGETGIEVTDDADSDRLAGPDTRCVNAPPAPPETSRNGTTARAKQPRLILRTFTVAGWQRQQGPVFNYARSISWLNFADRLYLAFEAADKRTRDRNGVPSQDGGTEADHVRLSADCGLSPPGCTHARDGARHRPQHPATEGGPASLELTPLVGARADGSAHHRRRRRRPSTVEEQPPAAAEGPPSHELVEYTGLGEMSPGAMSTFLRHAAWSMLVALALQWGTTGWAIYISYETVVKGLGCRSGSYVVYGVVATASCAAMLFSAWVSHYTMRGYQHGQGAEGRLQLYGAVAVVTRVLGQALLIGNTVWLLAISIFELIGFFDSCYCAGTQLSKGLGRGWILLFKNADALKADAQDAWKTGIGMGFVTTFLAVVIFSLASRQKPEPQDETA
ncbi:hypothetical protein LX36DRAFT_258647 [Colletotrichum falcatum]|nr:hypothetical protein LX36DRAFT_258647 [Colletotrichum falcatum]